eukprot:CAMPEP_0173195522 /NCGR_PEP_ID=MMETSP1141-20130122/15105_1 /TAXON_ID=483371 /ORGANISM="non described non described, Strain CCMP2298" /LENGTH=475 /DNA_ID=CAMNT_0014120067 /DNA_START=89 /DNA_END=1516 /DNA_ORIENTATION=+
MAGEKLVSKDSTYSFGGIDMPGGTSTSFRRTLKGNAYFYTVKDIVVFVENMDEALAVYRKKAVEARVTAVVELDKSALRGYLTGLTATAPQIDQQAAVSFVAPAAPRPVAPSAPSGTEKTQEQRDKHAARAERKSKDAGDSAHSMKRKIAAAFGADEGVDAEILEADRQRLKELRSDEIPAHTRSTVLNNSGMDFSVVLRLFNERVLKPKQAPKAAPAPPGSKRAPVDPRRPATAVPDPRSRPSSSEGRSPGRDQAQRGYPIIIVPSAMTSAVTTANVKDFLMDGKFVTVETKRLENAPKPKELLLQRELPGAHLMYKVINDPARLDEAEWDRVVAVFVTGQLWQFKNWKYTTAVDLFQHVLGFHVTTGSATVDANVDSWACRVLKVADSGDKQHENASASKDFWIYLDDFVRMRKPHLLPGAQRRAPPPQTHQPQSHQPQSHQSQSQGTRPVPPPPQFHGARVPPPPPPRPPVK